MLKSGDSRQIPIKNKTDFLFFLSRSGDTGTVLF
jgi:hypothetical protein